MRAAWWWIDRWRKSTAYTDMTLAEQGAYRNLLDELWLREGLLPNDERILAKACGDALEWQKVRGVVLPKFRLTPDGYRNDTHDSVMAQAVEFRERQRDKGRARAALAARGPAGRYKPSQPDDQPDDQPSTSRTGKPESSLPSPITDHRTPSPEPSQTTATTAYGGSPSGTTAKHRSGERAGHRETIDTFIAVFNAAFARRVGAIASVEEKALRRLSGGVEPWQLVAAPLLVAAQGLTDEMRKAISPEVLVRDGKHPRATRAGYTAGGTDWIERALLRADQTVLDAKLTGIARVADEKVPGLLDKLASRGVRFTEPGGGAP